MRFSLGLKDDSQILNGSILKGLIKYFIPIVIGSLFQQLYNTVDTIIVGNYVGTNALAAVGGSAGEIAGVSMYLFMGIANGATVTVAQHYGARNYDGVHRDIHNGYALVLIGGLLFTVFGLIFVEDLLRLMNTNEVLMEDSLIYMNILFSGYSVALIYNMGTGVLRALGDSVHPLYILIACCFCNIFLDIVLVKFIPLGVAGVAIATVASQALSAFLVTKRVMTKLDDRYRLKLRKIKIYPEVMKAQLKIGLPSGFQSAMYGIANITIQSFINMLSTETVAAFSAFRKVDSFFWMANGALGTSVTTFAGQNYGAGRLDRVNKTTKTGVGLHALFSVFFSVVALLFGETLFRIFTPDEKVIEIGIDIIRIMTPFYITYSLVEILSASLRGIGIVIVPTILTLTGICVLRIVWMSIMMPKYPTMVTAAIVYPVSWAVTSLLFLIYFIYRWRKVKREALSVSTAP